MNLIFLDIITEFLIYVQKYLFIQYQKQFFTTQFELKISLGYYRPHDKKYLKPVGLLTHTLGNSTIITIFKD